MAHHVCHDFKYQFHMWGSLLPWPSHDDYIKSPSGHGAYITVITVTTWEHTSHSNAGHTWAHPEHTWTRNKLGSIYTNGVKNLKNFVSRYSVYKSRGSAIGIETGWRTDSGSSCPRRVKNVQSFLSSISAPGPTKPIMVTRSISPQCGR
jgi:hypothetical protein